MHNEEKDLNLKEEKVAFNNCVRICLDILMRGDSYETYCHEMNKLDCLGLSTGDKNDSKHFMRQVVKTLGSTQTAVLKEVFTHVDPLTDSPPTVWCIFDTFTIAGKTGEAVVFIV